MLFNKQHPQTVFTSLLKMCREPVDVRGLQSLAGLVQQQQPGARTQRACCRKHLLLTPGQCRRTLRVASG